LNFKIGDWLVYKKEVVLKIINNPNIVELERKKEVRYPVQVAALNPFNSEMMYVLLSNDKRRISYKIDFIFATDEEIKNEKIRKKLKNIFIK
jgi:hypothetical protein